MKTEGKTLVEVFGQENGKHGIELRFGKGKKLMLLSYAVYVNGACQVSHETTAANRKTGMNIQRHLEIEKANNPSLPIL